jgi:ERCC4-type nuclease
MSKNYNIIIDDRERAVAQFFKDEAEKNNDDITHTVLRITTGDFAITFNGKLKILIERKTWADLAATIKGDRRENIKNLNKNRDDSPDTVIAYIIEGNPTPNPKSYVGRMQYSSLIAHLDHAAMRDNICIFYTRSPEDTYKRLYTIVKNHMTLNKKETCVELFGGQDINQSQDLEHDPEQEQYPDLDPEQEQDPETESILIDDELDLINNSKPERGPKSKSKKVIKKLDIAAADTEVITLLTTVQKKSEEQILYNLWTQIPYITSKTASLFIEEDITIKQLLLGQVDINTISTMKYTSGVIVGTKRASKILLVTKNNPYAIKVFIKILSEIPLISKLAACAILKTYSILQLITLVDNKENRTNLANIQKTEKTKIGAKATEHIFKYLIDFKVK